ncbi:MAG TPA: hypothetical protein VF452_14745, partial [Candidatus Binatia bacterium]
MPRSHANQVLIASSSVAGEQLKGQKRYSRYIILLRAVPRPGIASLCGRLPTAVRDFVLGCATLL